ncbi:hypothetical protein UCREL1_2774 [Eutypa lata UCREL1]|uniref:Uncharacterized protein n=1 Tax=Eutypa lata (strain UCR-EL1) TaxID=1287681 RepID=M7T070_EUTLA|nr:hypothetical protein UCREL1_2774 [Eutypa lata UCREL1]
MSSNQTPSKRPAHVDQDSDDDDKDNNKKQRLSPEIMPAQDPIASEASMVLIASEALMALAASEAPIAPVAPMHTPQQAPAHPAAAPAPASAPGAGFVPQRLCLRLCLRLRLRLYPHPHQPPPIWQLPERVLPPPLQLLDVVVASRLQLLPAVAQFPVRLRMPVLESMGRGHLPTWRTSPMVPAPVLSVLTRRQYLPVLCLAPVLPHTTSFRNRVLPPAILLLNRVLLAITLALPGLHPLVLSINRVLPPVLSINRVHPPRMLLTPELHPPTTLLTLGMVLLGLQLLKASMMGVSC